MVVFKRRLSEEKEHDTETKRGPQSLKYLLLDPLQKRVLICFVWRKMVIGKIKM
jgi:hypothetical protein